MLFQTVRDRNFDVSAMFLFFCASRIDGTESTKVSKKWAVD